MDNADPLLADRRGPGLFPFVVGLLLGGLTFGIEKFAVSTGNSIVSAAGRILFLFLLPGMFGAIILAQNIHDFPIWVAAAGNAGFYFGLAWLVVFIRARLRPPPSR